MAKSILSYSRRWYASLSQRAFSRQTTYEPGCWKRQLVSTWSAANRHLKLPTSWLKRTCCLRSWVAINCRGVQRLKWPAGESVAILRETTPEVAIELTERDNFSSPV